MSDYPQNIMITEVGPRDGLQNQTKLIDTNVKVAFINELSQSGLKKIEASAFVNPTWVAQLADADEVFEKIDRHPDVKYSALVPNERGFERAVIANVNEIGVLTSASETFCEKNINTSIQGSLKRLIPLVEMAHSHDMNVRCYVSTVFACPYEGKTDFNAVVELTLQLIDCGIDDIDYGDTIGVAVPEDIRRLFDALDGLIEPSDAILHLHNTNSQALSCAKEAMMCGVFKFDASCGGLGGCPYAPGAAGNLSTEDLVHFATQHGIETNVVLQTLLKASALIEPVVDCPLTSEVYNNSKESI